MRANPAGSHNAIWKGWKQDAACRGPESLVFFPPAIPERRDDRAMREAKAKGICQQCSVQSRCLDFAVTVGEAHGIWGGLTESERRGLAPTSAS